MPTRAALRFALIGAVLFALGRFATDVHPPAPPGAIDALSDDDLLYRAALARGFDRDDPVVQARLIRNMGFLQGAAAGAGALHADALDLGMADGDLVVRRRLIERMRLLIQQPALAAEPSQAELQAYLDAHADRFTVPARVSFTQLFLDPRRRGAALAVDASRLLARLGAHDVERAASLADALPLPAHVAAASHADVARLFGASFASALRSLPVGRWSGPLQSPYGAHLVWVEDRQPERRPELAAVRAQVRAGVREQRAAAALDAALRAWRAGAARGAGAAR